MPANASAPDDLVFVLRRELDVPARFVFRACSEPEHLMQWFGPPGCPLVHCEVDFNVGGRWRFRMKGPDGALGPFFGGEYLEIVDGQKIVYSNAFELPGAEAMIVTITLAERDGRTSLVHATRFASEAQKREILGRGYEVGLGLTLDALAVVVRRLA